MPLKSKPVEVSFVQIFTTTDASYHAIEVRNITFDRSCNIKWLANLPYHNIHSSGPNLATDKRAKFREHQFTAPIRDKNPEFWNVPNPLHKSGPKLACENTPIIHAHVSNFIWIDLLCQPWGVKKNKFGHNILSWRHLAVYQKEKHGNTTTHLPLYNGIKSVSEFKQFNGDLLLQTLPFQARRTENSNTELCHSPLAVPSHSPTKVGMVTEVCTILASWKRFWILCIILPLGAQKIWKCTTLKPSTQRTDGAKIGMEESTLQGKNLKIATQ